MKKFIAMVMTAAMVASLVPATAFARGDEAATARVVDAKDFTKDAAKAASGVIFDGVVTDNGPELRLTMTEVVNQLTSTGALPDFTFELSLDNAEWTQDVMDILEADDMDHATSPLTDFISIWDDSENFWLDSATTLTKSAAVPGTPATEATTYTQVDTALVSTLADAAAVQDLIDLGTSDGVASAAPASPGTTTKPTAYITWEDLSDMVTPAKTSAEVIDEWEEAGWTKVLDPLTGDVVAMEKGNTSQPVTWSSTPGEAEPPFAPVAAMDLKQALTAAIGSSSYFTIIEGTSTVAAVPGTPAGSNLTGNNDETGAGETLGAWYAEVVDYDTDYAKIKVTYFPQADSTGVAASKKVLDEDDYIAINLGTAFTKTAVGTAATVEVDGLVSTDALVYATIEARGITATTKKVGVVAEEEKNTLKKDLVITSVVGDFVEGQVIELKLSKGFEFVENDLVDGVNYYWNDVDGNYAEIVIDNGDATADGALTDEIIIRAEDCTIEATSAKAGATCTMTVKALKDSQIDGTFADTTTVEVMTVVDYTVIMSVDEDADVPVIYSGVNVDNYGINDDSDHLSLEVTIEETFPGAWSFRKGFNLELPEGVYVTDVNLIEIDGFIQTQAQNTTDDATDDEDPVDDDEMMEAFFEAYQEGDHVNFEFAKRVFDDVDTILADTEAKMVFELELVADPTFVGDVTLKLAGELVDEQEVVIANFVPVYTVAAEQNDLKIDYRYTEIPTDIVVTETEAGLWAKNEATFGFYMDKEDYIVFEDDPIFTLDDASGMKLDDAELNDDDHIVATVDTESDEPATITISGMSLFMQRSIPAGPYDLKGWTSMGAEYKAQQLFAPDCFGTYAAYEANNFECDCWYDTEDFECLNDEECIVGDVCDFSSVVKEAFVNVVTAGREQDDASFTTIVQVPVGENYLVAGEVTVELDVPAYINANGYTMLPVRAVAKALGINNNNVLWDQATKTVTILYGQRIITMQVGASVIYVNGSAIPASSSVEIVDGRTFLGLRDLATALGVTTIDWDPATKTALLNAEFED